NPLNYQALPCCFRPYKENGYTHSPIPDIPGDVNMFGYFQSAKYFDNCPDLIRHHFTPKIETEAFLRGLWALELEEVTCSIHIRRGDYLISPHIYPACTVDYYRNAVDYMKKNHGVTRFMVFGDDMGWARQTLQGDEFTFVEGQKSIEDLFLMSFCDHNIIANSSFSWWGSYLNANPSKVVVAPRRWILNQNAKDVYCPNWTIL
ncbi:MAG: alpha-1,2-fucosyltransferase, partial [Bacteroidota bacterium]